MKLSNIIFSPIVINTDVIFFFHFSYMTHGAKFLKKNNQKVIDGTLLGTLRTFQK
jgi:hypothetical protein